MFTGSAAMAAGGLGLLAAPAAESGPARNLALLGQVMEMVAFERMTRRIGMTAEPYRAGRGGAYIRAGQVLGALGATGAALSGTPLVRGARPRLAGRRAVRRRPARRVRRDPVRDVFHAGMESARDPKYTVVPQRQRLAERAAPAGRPVALPPA